MPFYSVKDELLENYKSQVELKYKMLNGLFFNTPLDKEHNANAMLATFSNICKNLIDNAKDPIERLNIYILKCQKSKSFKSLSNSYAILSDK
ncbi:hypothetical protein [Francisella hispaniensis]|uniref:hypothetical protein n=1 Tax=Francisella hispaniensis TaxID=622488 RepID=UPI001E2EF136|nr:hypothetical protein [Francisella hispaniensis]